ncbi:MAG: polyamine aminopropyltransferase [Clostridiales bacterium]|nr:polyamine aminopropyltransferase [Clostridiales bacterium]MCF8021405.1 polyamine aminopropyltransferase [Clostridiales bacterium]
MEVWFTEDQTSNLKISCKVKEVLYHRISDFQKVVVIDTVEFGRMLTLDDVIQTTEKEEFVYHELITHVGLVTHPEPCRVLVIGGGDGGSIREVIKHDKVQEVVHVEIDDKVMEAAKMFLPTLSSGFNSPKVEIRVEDGIKHVKEHKNTYDMIIIDSSDPVGPAKGLFSKEFYQTVFEALKEDGLFVAQTESPFFNQDLIKNVHDSVGNIFPINHLFCGVIPTYPGGYWSFTMGSKIYDPLNVDNKNISELNTRWYSPDIHKAAFILPPFVKNYLK